MANKQKYEPPKQDKADVAHSVARAVISSVPVLEKTFFNFAQRRQFFDLLTKDLHSKGLVKNESLNLSVNSYGQLVRLTSSLGRQFVTFIASPLEPDH